MSKPEITLRQVDEYVNKFKSASVVAQHKEIVVILMRLFKDKKCQVYNKDRRDNVKDFIWLELLKLEKNALWLTQSRLIDEAANEKLEGVLNFVADFYLDESYMGIHVNRVLVDLSSTKHATTLDELKAIVDSFADDVNVAYAYKMFQESKLDSETFQVDSDLYHGSYVEFRSALLDCLKAGLGISCEDDDDAHSICYDAINEYDESQLITREAKDAVELIALKFYLKADVTELYDDLVSSGYAKDNTLDGNTFEWNDDLRSQVAFMIYYSEIYRLNKL